MTDEFDVVCHMGIMSTPVAGRPFSNTAEAM